MSFVDFKDVNPDTLYESCDHVIDFFYVIPLDSLHWDRDKSHRDMIFDNPEISEDVFGDLECDFCVEKLILNRSEATVITGAMAEYNKTPLIAVWANLADKNVKSLLNRLIFEFPQVESLKDRFIVVGMDGEPKLLKELVSQKV